MTLAAYNVAKGNVEYQYQQELSRIQANGSSETLFKCAQKVLCEKIESLREKYKLIEGYGEEKAALEKAYWNKLQGLEDRRAKEEKDIETLVGQPEAMTVAGIQISPEANQLHLTYQKKLLTLNKKYEMPDEPDVLIPQSSAIEEGKDEGRKMGGFIKEFFRSHRSSIEKEIKKVFEDPAIEIPRLQKNVENQLKRASNRTESIEEGIFSKMAGALAYPFKWFYQRILFPILKYFTEPIGTYIWKQKVEQVDPSADYRSAILHPGTDKEMSREDFDAIFYPTVILIIISMLISYGYFNVGIVDLVWALFAYAYEALESTIWWLSSFSF